MKKAWILVISFGIALALFLYANTKVKAESAAPGKQSPVSGFLLRFLNDLEGQ
ncbi:MULTISPECIES: hypothetical protein [Bacillus]|jgi:hypothetical protein|uniref:hypothetical protein n=1 Tax=Bacillus TaxID=1386 RepID=UPI0002059528|nr:MULTISPECIES: hypothetical protein [Bacillus amyloliquefaciens group]AEB25617.1 hypothetical protein BAMTA208_17325 [Bacillus amyloliquefaciens TA208]AEB65079.1 hypothetical protein LL3_03551 [Bacillus amyloliquefaciens LL3]AEK90652.1 hypothetical protein BAXH7_03540 [Bacillus amyloliquefaciens XH7]AOC92518.1 hypothetical protein BARD7_03078 [Bacillus amyloliquefaciens]ARW40618.1 hypothetical protein S101267_03559 [Bacillus amyloliquefaciens]